MRITAGEAVEKNQSLAAGASPSGRVTDKSGTPVIGAHVTLQHGDGTSVSIDTWAGGEYSMTGLRPGTYLLSVSPPSGLNLLTVAIADVRIAPAENVTRDVELPGGAILQGVVRDADGSPVPYPRLQLRNGKDETWSVLGNAEGAYSFQGLRAGRYDLVAAPTRLGEIRPAPAFMPSILVTEGGTVAQDLVLPTGGTLVVKVTDAAGNPVPDASLELTVDEPLVFKDAWRSTTTDESGEARFTELSGLAGGYERLGLPSCVATVMVEPPSGVLTPGKLENVRVQAGQETEASIVLPAGGTITGRIEDASGAGVRGVFVYMPETDASAEGCLPEGPEFVAVSDITVSIAPPRPRARTPIFDPARIRSPRKRK